MTLTVLQSWAYGQTGTRPGRTDPLGSPSRRTLFADHEVLTFLPHYFPDQSFGALAASYSTDSNVTAFTPLFPPAPPRRLPSPHIVAAAGRIVTEAQDQVVYAQRRGTDAAVFVFDPASRTTTHSTIVRHLAMPPAGSTEFMDIATGDLDNQPDAHGRNHDEVVLCYARPGQNGQFIVQVAVLDYTTGDITRPLRTIARASTTIDGNQFGANTVGLIHPVDTALACAVGDVNGDGQNDIAVTHLQNATTLWVHLFRYQKTASDAATLQEVSAQSLSLTPWSFQGTVDIVAGDFNGDGIDELAVASASWFPAFEPLFFARVTLFGSNATFGLSVLGAFADFRQFFGAVPTSRVQVVAGLFKFDPANGFDFSRRQLTLVYHFPSGSGAPTALVTMVSLIPSDDLLTVSMQSWRVALAEPATIPLNGFSAAAGNFRGYVTNTAPLWSIVLGFWNPSDGTFMLKPVHFDTNGNMTTDVPAQVVKNAVLPYKAEARLPVVAYDADGDALYVGAPMHLTLSNLVRTDFLIQEPPKHLAYLKGRIRNISRRSNFYVELKDSNATTFSTKSRNTTDWNIGGALETSAGGTVTGKGDIGVVQVEAEASLDVTTKIGLDYEEHLEEYTSGYAQRTLTFTGQTNLDDYLVSQIQTFDVWRYRLYGVAATNPQGKPVNTFYELVLPGPTLEARGGGLTFEWYHPIHENGNILSYPRLTNQTVTPADLGTFTLPGGAVRREPLVPPQLLSYDGTSGTLQLDFSTSSGAGRERQYGTTLSASVDLHIATKASASYFGVGGSVRASVHASLNNRNSWSTLTTSNNTSSRSTGITLHKPFNGDHTLAYPFTPLVYIARDGTLKVTHAVGNLNDADSWWQETYGRKPDPALNLPRRFLQNASGKWVANTRASRKQMRGFFVCQPAATATAPCATLTRNPVAGEAVRLQARVYNYSTAKLATNVTIRFQAVKYDAASNREIGPRLTLGDTTIAQIQPRQMQLTALRWDTTGFGPTTGRGLAEYRLYVVVDPGNTIAELYETEPAGVIDPGQNNEGWGAITIAAPRRAATVHTAPVSLAVEQESSVYVDTIEAVDAQHGRLQAPMIVARRGQPLPVRVRLASPETDMETYYVLVFASDPQQPEQPAEVIAGKVVQGVDAEHGAYVWLEWLPQTLGTIHLRAVLTETLAAADSAEGNSVLTVRVVE